MKQLLSILLFTIFSLTPAFAQHTCTGDHCEGHNESTLENIRYTPSDVERFNQAMEVALPCKDLPMNELAIKIAKSFLGTPYVASTLEKDPEQLTINMNETDCILFVEMCLALSLTAKSDEATFEKYCENVLNLRYAKGVVDGYPSRLHYTSSWIIQGSERGIMKEITHEIGGVESGQQFYFMSSHSDSYRQLKENPALVDKIRATETGLNNNTYYFIPQDDLEGSLNKVQTGDIICFNCATKGLDIAHVAYAYWDKGVLTFIHASFGAKKVIIEPKTLAEYIRSSKNINGLRVVRLL